MPSRVCSIDWKALCTNTRGVINKVLYVKAPPLGPTPYFFICLSGQRSYPFRIYIYIYLLLTNGTPFTYLVQNSASLLTLSYHLNHKTRRFLDFFSALKMNLLSLLDLLGPFLITNRNDRFFYPFIYFTRKIFSRPSKKLKPEKGTPCGLLGEASIRREGHYSEYPQA